MAKYRCSQCKTTYLPDEYADLERVAMDEDEPRRGQEVVCSECAAGFHSDKWRRQDTVEHDGREYHVSTVALNIPHGMSRDQWYETMAEGQIMDRYRTEPEAIDGHDAICRQLRNGEYRRETVATQLVLEGENDG